MKSEYLYYKTFHVRYIFMTFVSIVLAFKYKSCFMLGQAIFKMFDTPINSSFIAFFVSN